MKSLIKNKRVLAIAKALYLLIGSRSISDFWMSLRVVFTSNNEKAISQVIKEKKRKTQRLNNMLIYLFKRDSQQSINNTAAYGFNSTDMPQFIVKTLGDSGVSLDALDSFKQSLNHRSRLKQLSNNELPEWVLEHKNNGHKFIDLLKVRRPDSTEHISLSNIEFREGIVIKPSNAHSSVGVYLIHSMDDIYDVKKKRTLKSITELKNSMRDNMVNQEVKEDDWIIEELLYDNQKLRIPARDLKFFTFYGKVLMIKEVLRYPVRKVVFWTPEGQQITPLIKDDPLLEGIGFSKEEIETAEYISQNIPSPFVRIDFLKGEKGMFFSEFAPRTGTYDKYTEAFDRLMGLELNKAETRLFNDMMSGKKFDLFNSLTEVAE